MKYTILYKGNFVSGERLETLTYGELKQMLPCVDGSYRLPRPERLMKDFYDERLISISLDETVITVFRSGLCHCRASGRTTAYAVSRCAEIFSGFTNRKLSQEENDILRMPWYAPLMLAGLKRLENNRNGREKSRSGFHYGLDPDKVSGIAAAIPADNEKKRRNSKRNRRRKSGRKTREKIPEWLRDAAKSLTGRQEHVLQLVYVHGMTQKQAAEELHTSEANISSILKRAYDRIRKTHPQLQYRCFVNTHK